MNYLRRYLLLLSVLGSIWASLLLIARDRRQSAEPAILTGTVIDARSLAPLSGVEISWKSKKVRSDSAGGYEMELPLGIREVSFAASDRPVVRKTLLLRESGARVTLDVLLAMAPANGGKVLALDRGSRVTQHGTDLPSDVPADSTISVADQYGNNDQLLHLQTGRFRVHSPVWLNPTTIAFTKEGVVHRQESSKMLGVFRFQLDSTQIQQVASGIAAHFLSKAPTKNSFAIADQKSVYILDSNPGTPRRIFRLPATDGFLLSVAWAPDDRIYFTIDDRIQLDDRRFLTKSRIASIKADGTDLKPDWAASNEYSYRYPVIGDGGDILFGRFALDGKQQALWSRNIKTGVTKHVAEPALRAVHLDSNANRLYYIYQQSLHLRDLRSGADWVILNSVREADYVRP